MLYARNFSTSACGKLFLTEMFKNIEFPMGKFSEDLFTVYKVLDMADNIIYGNQICYYYYRRPDSMITSNFSVQKLDVIEAMHNIKKDIPLQEYGIEKAYASQMIEVITLILESEPTNQEVIRYQLWNLIKQYRRIVILDPKASKRVRAYALISYFGITLMKRILKVYYNLKWKKNSRE